MKLLQSKQDSILDETVAIELSLRELAILTASFAFSRLKDREQKYEQWSLTDPTRVEYDKAIRVTDNLYNEMQLILSAKGIISND